MRSLTQQESTLDFWVLLKPNSTVSSLLHELEKSRELRINFKEKNIAILVNGRPVDTLEGLETKLKDLDKVFIMPIIGGG
jgi:molybdopterin converting factor small subunit